ncbi:V-type ATPase 116kDa subunit family protein [Anaerococcus sp. Marseille-Q7828]|uniref:V-type ATP synthase subunit I n=1 Tax=Anaerococcus sp. Marseille-Q7828 TaxID=3036300 RepID=UPI0024ACB447|nr:V-type ATPase 116kDa subunit family protein [Anaerococcus sp. Marseille-Q7828]
MANRLNTPKVNSQALEDDYLLLYPKKVLEDISRSINSLGFVDKDLSNEKSDYDIANELDVTRRDLENIDHKIDDLKDSYKDIVDNIPYNINYQKKAEHFEESMAYGEKYFYFSAQVPEKKLKELEDMADKYPDTRISNDDNSDFKVNPNKDNKKLSNEEDYLLIYPNKVKKDVSRSVNTLGFVDKDLPKDLLIKDIDEKQSQTKKRLNEINSQIEEINRDYQDILGNISYSIEYEKKSDELKNNMAHGDEYFYLSGWVPESELNKFESLEDKYKNTIITTKDVDSVNEQPPTKLKNNKFVRPFEYMVNMYGAPNYDEIDPTPFFAITYMLLYGLMFGDLGQGLVFLGLGFWLSKKNETFGAILKRIGISASIFGLMYGSFFGREDLIPALLIKPFDNIMTVLIASVVFGVSLMVISYIIGIYNKVHLQKNIEEGIFGKEGFAGLMMMASFIIIVLAIVNVGPVPKNIGVILLIISIVMMVFKQPIARKLEGNKKLYDQAKGDYYLEGSFSVIEALLSVFSNLVSFTRVGAFAINHVGLYMAFEVMAKLAGGGIKGFIILVIGNIFIIGLEGMIVGIQGLRLEFYEMFSKYYEGNGHLFRPINQRNFNK